MWHVFRHDVPSGYRFEPASDGRRLSFREYIDRLDDDDDFADWYGRLLAHCPFAAFYWEHPALTERNVDAPAEFVLLSAPALESVRPDPEPFREHFDAAPDAAVVTFTNLGGDARLVAPRPLGELPAYPHLAAFVRRAPATQVRAVWRTTARAARDLLGARPRWLSTAGLGVAWLHLRLDSTPKYYNHLPYTRGPQP